MLFNSFEFLIFFPIVVAFFFALPHRARWVWLLASSYFFYMWFEPWYGLLLLGSSAIGWGAALAMEGKEKAARKPWMWAAVVGNLALLFFFKYYDWANANLTALSGRELLPFSKLMLPMGISFFTLQTMGYAIDVYRGRLPAMRHFGVFALFISYFPQLVAGPIERATHLAPQFFEERHFDSKRAVDGLQLMVWGLFKKAVVADRLAQYSKLVYDSPQAHGGPLLTTATIFFCIQVYCDFSGYSDIAVGAAKVMGFDIMENFRRPYLAKNIDDLWSKRWHISLVGWLKDYVFNPLAYLTRRSPPWRRHANVLIIFFITGLWHGADWKFVAWGVVNGVFVLAHLLSAGLRQKLVLALRLDRVPLLHTIISVVFTFLVFSFGSIFFVAKSFGDAFYVITHLFSGWGLGLVRDIVAMRGPMNLLLALGAIALMVAVELHQERRGSVRAALAQKPAYIRWPIYYAAVLAILLFGVFDYDQFIYFQF